MRKAMVSAIAMMALLALVNTAKAADTCSDGCPVVGAARQAGASKEALAKITTLRDQFIVDFGKITQSSEYQQASRELEGAKKKGDAEAVKTAETKMKTLAKPAWDTFHKGASETLGKDLYAVFYSKLPEWAKS